MAALVVFVLALAAPAAAGPRATTADWPQFHAGPAHTGWNTTETILSPATVGSLTERWSVTGDLAGSPIVVGERVFATVGEQLVAVRRSDGSELWRVTVPGGPIYPPAGIASGGGLVLVAAADQLLAYEQSDGSAAWAASIGGSSRGPTIAGDGVFIGSSDHHVYAFALANGKLRWTATMTDEVQSLIAVDQERVFAASMDGTLSAFSQQKGKLKWSATVGGVYGGGAAVAKGVVYIASNAEGVVGADNYLYAFRAANGHRVWSAPLGDDVHSVPAVDGNSVYIGLIVAGVKAFAADNGTERWNTEFGGAEVWSSTAVANGLLYLTTDGGTAYALDTASGAVAWSDTPPRPPDVVGSAAMSSPAVAGGVLYVGFGDALRAYGLGS